LWREIEAHKNATQADVSAAGESTAAAGVEELADSPSKPPTETAKHAEAEPAPPAASEDARPERGTGQNPAESPTWGRPVGNWADIDLVVLDIYTIQVRQADVTREVGYAEMGFADPRGSRPGGRGGRSGDRGPTKAWQALIAFANYDGVLSTKRAASDDAESRSKALGFSWRRVREIRDRLRHYFRLADDPIPQDAEGYRTAFKISRAAD
jgi:hypothetical protein